MPSNTKQAGVEPLSAEQAKKLPHRGWLDPKDCNCKHCQYLKACEAIRDGRHVVVDQTLPPVELAAALAKLLPPEYKVVHVRPRKCNCGFPHHADNPGGD